MNQAEYYLKEIQSNPNKYDQIRQSVKKYNQAVLYCNQGSDDLAVIQLKKVITDNPQLLKAYQLMGLLHFKQGNYEAARKYLNKAFKINKTDSTTLRYMKELDNLYKKGGKRRELGESRASVAEKI